MKTKKTRFGGGLGIRHGVYTAVGCMEDDEATTYQPALGHVGHRTQNSMESHDRTAEELMYACTEDDEHEDTSQRRTTLEAGNPSSIPFTTSPHSSPSNPHLHSL